MHIYEYKDYRNFLEAKIAENVMVRGYQMQLASAASCSKSYFSQVLSGSAQFTPDHAANLSNFFGFGEEETFYFIDLVNYDRAASPELKKILNTRLETARENYISLENKFVKSKSLSDQESGQYYSSWINSAIHILLTIPDFRDGDVEEKISKRLGVPLEAVQGALTNLEKFGIIKFLNNKWEVVTFDLHVSEQFDKMYWAKMHNMNWRQKTILKIQEDTKGDVHYVGVHSMSKSDAVKIKNLLAEVVEKSRLIIGPSPEEELYCMLFDFYVV